MSVLDNFDVISRRLHAHHATPGHLFFLRNEDGVYLSGRYFNRIFGVGTS
jgi:hypothetical protein